MNKQSNTYTIIYIVILVLVVGTALAATSLSLRSRQQANADADKMRQILSAAHIVTSGDDVIEQFNKSIVNQMVVNYKGIEVTGNAFDIDMSKQVKLPSDKRKLPVFVCETTDGTKYILPAYGAGLWGPIWGYIALDADGSTVYGAFFAHAGETPGLGAEIEKPKFCDEFVGKQLFKDGKFFPIEVVKTGQKPQQPDADYVDGVSGGTITSKGVGSMIDNCLSPYKTFLQTLKNK